MTVTISNSRRVSSIGTVLAFLVAAETGAQRQVVVPSPALYSRTYPNNLLSVPPAGSATTVYQNLFSVEPQVAGVALDIAFRRSDFTSSPPTYPALTVELEFGMSHSPRPVALPSAFLASNRGPDYRVVVDRRTFQFPPSTIGHPPYPFDYRFPFDRPFLLVAGNTAMWEVTRHRSSSRTTDLAPLGFDAASWLVDHSGAPVTSIGQPCGSGRYQHENRLRVTPLTVGSFATAWINAQVDFGGASFAWLFWGLAGDHWGPFMLPMDLTPYGAPGCWVHVGMEYLWPLELQMPRVGLNTEVALEVPNDPGLAGVDVYFQGVRFTRGLNAAGLATSNGEKARIGPRFLANGSEVMFWAGAGEFGSRSTGSMIFALTVF